ncbi:MAG TPA: UDP-N-acetylmuramoyl-L-alanyl-D-glutamate--2,6-diaminopimelate ligase [Fimbriimonas sp.]|nr:UDP-N-acetylmuramoyl-L-alanyl-D-glutamate--2,6-diaminopimelate ligase [Fimbriimonas sp.]
MRLSEIFKRADVPPVALSGDAEVTGLVMDSRMVRPGGCFVCMPGTTTDSHSYLAAAAAAGAIAAIVHSADGLEEAQRRGLAVAQLPEEKMSFADAIWRICDAFFEHPTRNMKVIGVTGTNGKTTTAWIVRDMLRALGMKAAYLGTLGFQLPDEERELSNTTPFAVDLYNLLAEARDKGVEALAMEVSSHALKERRVDGVEFDVGVFTNLTQDHLDYHGSMEDYEDSKWRLFSELPKQSGKEFKAVINVGDAVGALWRDRLPPQQVVSVQVVDQVTEKVSVTCKPLSVQVDHLRLGFDTGTEQGVADVNLGGAYNVENCACAVAACLSCTDEWFSKSIEDSTAALDGVLRALERARPVPGRFEPVPNDQGIGILVDYAHTPDALEKLLDATRPLTTGRVISVFGCGGDRDRTKRPKMAKAASSRSDVTVVTSDNPRTEDPQSILDEVLTGIEPNSQSVAIIDRREAIAHAVRIAQPGDVVVIAGKGHENYQIIGRTKYPMDDRELAREGLHRRKGASS